MIAEAFILHDVSSIFLIISSAELDISQDLDYDFRKIKQGKFS
jgi:hypothetical protein